MNNDEGRLCMWSARSGWYVPQCQLSNAFTRLESWWIYCPYCGGKIEVVSSI